MGAMFRKKSVPAAGLANAQRTPIGQFQPAEAADWKIPRPNFVESMIPIAGPLWEAAADVQDGNYGGAAFNGVMAVADALPVSPAIKLVRLMGKLRTAGKLRRYEEGLASAKAMQTRYKSLELTKAGQELHHTIPHRYAGVGRTTKSAINHPALLKPMDKAMHRRLTGAWKGEPEFNSLQKLWHGTTDLQKTAPVGVTGYAADAWENLHQPLPPGERERRRR